MFKRASVADAGLGALLGATVGKLVPMDKQHPMRDAVLGAAVFIAAEVLAPSQPEEEEGQRPAPYVIPPNSAV